MFSLCRSFLKTYTEKEQGLLNHMQKQETKIKSIYDKKIAVGNEFLRIAENISLFAEKKLKKFGRNPFLLTDEEAEEFYSTLELKKEIQDRNTAIEINIVSANKKREIYIDRGM